MTDQQTGPETEQATAEGAEPARASANFWRYWSASTISHVGDAVATVALPLVAVSALNASAFEVSFLTAAQYAAWIILGLPAGVLVQRLPLRGTQVAMDLIRAIAMISIPVAYLLDVLRLGQLVLVALVVGLATVLFDVSNSTFLPSIVPKDELAARNSLISASDATTQLGGPSLGGVLVQFFGAALSLFTTAVGYLASALLLWRIPRPPRAQRDRQEPMLALIKEGWHYVVRHPVIRPLAVAATLANFICGGLLALIPVFLVRTLEAPPGLVGLLIATDGLGSLVAAMFTPRLVDRFGSARVILVATFAGAAAALLMPLAQPGWGLALFAVGNMGFGAGVVILSILARTHRQQVTPPDLLSRVMATVRFVSWGAVPVGALTAGAAATAMGGRGGMWLVCGLAFLAPVALAASSVRRRSNLA